jgi:hypothetical protein
MTKAPWHLWVVGVLALVWNAGGAFDYVMTQTRNEGYLAAFTAEQIAYFTSFPAWVDATWAIAVWSAVLGSLLLLLRNAWAEKAFWLSVVTMVLTALHTYILSEVSAIELMGPVSVIFSAAIFVVIIALALYARWMAGRGILK